MRSSRLIKFPFWFSYLFLYLPIIVVVFMSFNSSSNLFVWRGFSLKWYPEVFANAAIMDGLRNTLIVASSVTVLATILGTLMAVGIHRYTRGGLASAFAIAPALLPDLLLAIGILSLFSLLQSTLGLHSVILAHTTFAMAFVTAIVLARMANLDPSLEEASRDLGAGPVRTFLRVTLPQLAPGVVAGALLAFGVKGGYEAGVKFIEALQVVSHLANIGDAKSLVIHPASTTHRQLGEEDQRKAGVAPDMVRLSIGLETLDDILWDLDQALNQGS